MPALPQLLRLPRAAGPLAVGATVALGAAFARADTTWLVSQGQVDDVPSRGAAAHFLSADGRYAVFSTFARSWRAGIVDRESTNDIFLWDRETWNVTLVTHSAANISSTADGSSAAMALSPDGRFVLFNTKATDLVAGITDVNGSGRDDVYRWDRTTGTSVLVSHSSGSAFSTANNSTIATAISDDGRYVLLQSAATDLASGVTDTNATNDLWLWDATSGTIALVTHAAGTPSTAANGASAGRLMTADGRFVVYTSRATNLMIGVTDTNGGFDTYVWDRTTNQSVLVSHHTASTTTAAGASSTPVGVSTDGRWIALFSSAIDLVFAVNDANFGNDVFLWDQTTNASILVSHRHDLVSTTGNGTASAVALSDDGRYLALVSEATDLVAGLADTNAASDSFLWDRTTGSSVLISHLPASNLTTGNDFSSVYAISGDGRFVLLDTSASDLFTTSDTNQTYDVMTWDRTTGALAPVSLAAGNAATANSNSAPAAISDDGRHVLFVSRANDLVAGTLDGNDDDDAFLWDRNAAASVLVDRALPNLSSGAGGARPVRVNASGRFVAFSSSARNLVAGIEDLNSGNDTFLWDRSNGVSQLVSRSVVTAGRTANGESQPVSLSGNGRYLLFDSAADDLVSGVTDANASKDLFLWDRTLGTSVLVSHAASASTTAANGGAEFGAMTLDGLWVAFASTATDVISGASDLNGVNDAFLWNRDTGALTLISHLPTSATTAANGASFPLAISSDGRYVAVRTSATNVVGGTIDNNVAEDIYLWDRDTNSSVLVSHTALSTVTTANNSSRAVAVSGGGRYVAFDSRATNLVTGQVDVNGGHDVFLWDRDTNATTLVSHTASSNVTTGSDTSLAIALNLNGNLLTFDSGAVDLVPGGSDTNGEMDVFQWDRVSGVTSFVSHTATSAITAGDDLSYGPVVSNDGNVVAFLSYSFDLVSGMTDQNLGTDVFLWRRDGTPTVLVSHGVGTPLVAADDASEPHDVSGDGLYVTFSSSAQDIVTGDLGGTLQTFLWTSGQGGLNLLTPCRVFDSRLASDGPPLAPGVARVVRVAGKCGIPWSARSLTVNVTVTNPGSAGELEAYAGDQPSTNTGVVRFATGQTRANNATLRLALDATGTIILRSTASASIDAIVDVSGYFD
jgi:hypothetical protein